MESKVDSTSIERQSSPPGGSRQVSFSPSLDRLEQICSRQPPQPAPSALGAQSHLVHGLRGVVAEGSEDSNEVLRVPSKSSVESKVDDGVLVRLESSSSIYTVHRPRSRLLGMEMSSELGDGPRAITIEIASALLVLFSVAFTIAETVPNVQDFEAHNAKLWTVSLYLEITFTIVFVLEYFLRLYSADSRREYAFSFFGIVDAITAFPSMFMLVAVDGRSSDVVTSTLRLLRLVRMFRVLKLLKFVPEAKILQVAIQKESRGITVFMLFVTILLLISGSLFYLVESETEGFESIPHCVWWAAVTITTVGYGDVVPQSVIGRMLAFLLMLGGYGLLAVPTIISYGLQDNMSSLPLSPRRWQSPRHGCVSNTYSSHGEGDAKMIRGKTDRVESLLAAANSGTNMDELSRADAVKTECDALSRIAPEDCLPTVIGIPTTQLHATPKRFRDYPFTLAMATRPSDFDVMGMLRLGVCHDLTEAAIATFLTTETEMDVTTGSAAGPKPFISESHMNKSEMSLSLDRSAGCAFVLGVELEWMDMYSCSYSVGFFPRSRTSDTNSLPCLVMSIVQQWGEQSNLSCHGATCSSSVRFSEVPLAVRSAFFRLLTRGGNSHEDSTAIHQV